MDRQKLWEVQHFLLLQQKENGASQSLEAAQKSSTVAGHRYLHSNLQRLRLQGVAVAAHQ